MGTPASWKPGQSGNPNGRPKKQRALTEILQKRGSKTLEDADGKRRAGKRIVARLLWEGATAGIVTFPGGRILQLGSVDWKDIVKFLYAQIDGPPKAQLELSGDPNAPQVIEYVNNWRPNHPTVPALGPADSENAGATVQLAGSGETVAQDDAGHVDSGGEGA